MTLFSPLFKLIKPFFFLTMKAKMIAVSCLELTLHQAQAKPFTFILTEGPWVGTLVLTS